MNFKTLLKVLIFTAIETIGIGLVWDFFFDKFGDSHNVSFIVIASLLLIPFLTVEHIIARNTGQGKSLFASFSELLGLQIVLGVTEAVFWDLWRLIHQNNILPGLKLFGPVVAVIIFGVLLIVQHNAENNVNNRFKFLSRLFRSQGVTISIIEAVTAMAWIFADDASNNRVLALVPLFIGLTAEHVVRTFGEAKGVDF